MAHDPASTSVLFHERQAITLWWVRLIVVAIAALGWWAFIQQIVLGAQWGTKPAPDWGVWLIFLIAGLIVPVFMFGTRLETIVTQDALRLHYRFLKRRTVPLADIVSAHAVTYHPLLEYGGWGLRWSPGRGWAWNAAGNRGVRLELAGGKKLLVGSQRPEALAEALEKAAS